MRPMYISSLSVLNCFVPQICGLLIVSSVSSNTSRTIESTNDSAFSTFPPGKVIPGQLLLKRSCTKIFPCLSSIIHILVMIAFSEFAFLTEEYKGNFPLWLAPHQVEIIPVNVDLHYDYAREIYDEMMSQG